MQIFVMPVDMVIGENGDPVQFFEIEINGGQTIAELKEKISTKISSPNASLGANRILMVKGENADSLPLPYMEDNKKVADYSIENGGILNIYKWTGSIALENG